MFASLASEDLALEISAAPFLGLPRCFLDSANSFANCGSASFSGIATSVVGLPNGTCSPNRVVACSEDSSMAAFFGLPRCFVDPIGLPIDSRSGSLTSWLTSAFSVFSRCSSSCSVTTLGIFDLGASKLAWLTTSSSSSSNSSFGISSWNAVVLRLDNLRFFFESASGLLE